MGVAGAVHGLLLNSLQELYIGYCWCAEVHVCLSGFEYRKATASGDLGGRKAANIGGHRLTFKNYNGTCPPNPKTLVFGRGRMIFGQLPTSRKLCSKAHRKTHVTLNTATSPS